MLKRMGICPQANLNCSLNVIIIFDIDQDFSEATSKDIEVTNQLSCYSNQYLYVRTEPVLYQYEIRPSEKKTSVPGIE